MAKKEKSNKARRPSGASRRPSRNAPRPLARPNPVPAPPLDPALAAASGRAGRAAVLAHRAVAAVNSEKTTTTREAQRAADAAATQAVTHRTPTPQARRSKADAFATFRASAAEVHPEDPQRAWRAAQGLPSHALRAGASAAQLRSAEASLGAELPPSYYDFCLEWGSGVVFESPWIRRRIISAPDLEAELNDILRGTCPRHLLPFFDAGSGDYLALDTRSRDASGECPVIWWYDHAERGLVASSFHVWLNDLVARHGAHGWLEG